MTDEQFAQRESELKEKYPRMFDYPGLRPGEFLIGRQMADVAIMNLSLYRQKGLKSARCEKLDDDYYPIFANLREYLEVEEALKNQEAAQASS